MKLSRALIAPLAALALFSAHAADKLRIGVVPGAYADSVAVAAKEAKAQGIDVQVVEFTDWTTPNVAVDSGDLDINYFQHQPFLDNAIQKNGYKLASAGTGILANVGLYSLKHKAIAQVPQGGKVGIANDPVNQGRGLLLLQKVGLIKLKPGVGYLGSLDDITLDVSGQFVALRDAGPASSEADEEPEDDSASAGPLTIAVSLDDADTPAAQGPVTP